MKDNIFRKKSIEKVNSPEDLNNYLKVTNPPIWFALTAIIVLLIGAIIWGCVAKLETKASGVVVSDETGAVCYISEQDVAAVSEGSIVRIDGKEYTVASISENSFAAQDALSNYCMSLGGFESGENVYLLALNESVKSGNYSADIILESISPFSFLFNSSN